MYFLLRDSENHLLTGPDLLVFMFGGHSEVSPYNHFFLLKNPFLRFYSANSLAEHHCLVFLLTG